MLLYSLTLHHWQMCQISSQDSNVWQGPGGWVWVGVGWVPTACSTELGLTPALSSGKEEDDAHIITAKALRKKKPYTEGNTLIRRFGKQVTSINIPITHPLQLNKPLNHQLKFKASKEKGKAKVELAVRGKEFLSLIQFHQELFHGGGTFYINPHFLFNDNSKLECWRCF